MLHDIPIDTAYSVALARWQSPFSGFTSSHDPRTSGNALLTVVYGGLESVSAAYQELAPVLGSLPRPEPEYGDPAQQESIRRSDDTNCVRLSNMVNRSL